MAFDPNQHFDQFNFNRCRHVLVSVSGGSDSIGLLHGLHEYLHSLANRPSLSAVTVDHGLREGSAAEAAGVAAHCAKLGIPHVIKTWQGPKPLTGIQAEARRERRALTVRTATEISADVILTGHTLDDQIETVVMRQRRGSGRGLAGIAEASLAFDDRSDGRAIWIVRPLLDVPRTDIRSYLVEKQITWADDPSNENIAYERIAVRQELADMNDHNRAALLIQSVAAGRLRKSLAHDSGELLGAYVEEVGPGLIRVDPAAFVEADRSALAILMRTLVAFAGGAENLGDAKIASAVIDQAVTSGFRKGLKPWRETSNGALIEMRQTGVYLLRERRKGQPHHVEFDGRYRVTGAARLTKTLPATAGNSAVPASLVRRAQELEPLYGVSDEACLTAFEAARSGYALRRLVNPWPDLVPSFDVELAQKLSLKAGAGDFPALSVYRHGKN
jgi:tRNA(Ile)-lysidine synthase